MNNPILETSHGPRDTPPDEEEGDKTTDQALNSSFQNHLGPKTRETELRLGLSVSGFEEDKVCGKRFSMAEQWKGGSGLLRTSGFCYGAGAKRGFSDAMKGDQQTRDGFGNSWSFLQFQTRNLVCSPRKPGNFAAMNESGKDPKGLGQEKTVFEQNRPKIEASTPVSRLVSKAGASPIVGWPPVRTFRKNLIPQLKPVMEESPSPIEPAKKFEDSLFVKVNMDGFPIGRKIDLKAYDNYESLSRGLQQMFNSFFAVERKNQKETDQAASIDHVLIYEDNEGDRMLVGDVPWEMFISSVKRLWIINGSEAPIVGPRVANDQR